MRIHKVTITGFGPFRDKQVVDFDAFAGDGLFLIAGRTGAGKSSILDAIVYGLYGTTPRYNKEVARYRSDFAQVGDPTEVTVEFSTGNQRYRVIRTPDYQRPAKKGGGETTEKATAKLEALTSPDTWQGLAALPRDVAPKVLELIGLNADQFLQVMLLAQNRFQEFLLAKTEDRRALLRKLFGADRFEFYETYLDNLRKEREAGAKTAQDSLSSLTAQIETLAECSYQPTQDLQNWLDNLVQEGALKLESATAAQHLAAQQFTEAQKTVTEAQAIRNLQQRRNAAQAALTEVKANQQAALDWDIDIQGHQRATALVPTIRSWRSSQSTLTAARQRVVEAQAELAKIPAGSLTDEQLSQVTQTRSALDCANTRDVLLSEIATLEPVAVLEISLPQLKLEVTTAEQKHQTSIRTREAALTQVQELETKIAVDQAKVSELGLLAAQMDNRKITFEAAQIAQKTALAVPAAEQKLAAAESNASQAAQAQQQAADEVARLWKARIAGAAAELATELKMGEPCPVCGSSSHPNPASPPDQPVTAEMIQQAQDRVDHLAQTVVSANEAVTACEKQLTELVAKAGGLSVEAANAMVSAARSELESAQDAQKQLGLTQAAIVATQKQQARLSQQAETQLKVIHDLATESATVNAKFADAKQQVAQYRGAWDSIAQHLTALKLAQSGVSNLAAALRGLEQAESSAVSAQTALTETLAERGFANLSSAEAALLPEAKAKELMENLATHQKREAVAKATLAEPELGGLPAELIDLAPMFAVAQVAEQAAISTSSELGAIRERQKSISRLSQEAIALAKSSVDLLTELGAVKRLADTLRGAAPNDRKMRLIDFVLAAELEQIVTAANALLSRMRGGRYTLEYTDDRAKSGAQSGLGLRIMDSHTGKARPTESLSGGETFLASLALALGLAETVSSRAGGISLDTLFIDEGFGSLDPETLETAMETLDNLREHGRTVGVISHVDTMHE